MDMKPLFTDCRECRDNPTHQTRQKAIGARPVGRWYQVCAKHLPGSRGSQEVAKRFHDIEPLTHTHAS